MNAVHSIGAAPTKDDFIKMKELGSGAFGRVFLVEHRPTRNVFALKEFVSAVSDDGVNQSVLREISMLAKFQKLRHRNIIQMFGVFHYTSRNNQQLHVCLILEKCDWDLYEFMKGVEKDMPEAQIRTIARQILGGLAFLHDNGVIHRDLKPQNILVNKELSVKLADFGLARSAAAGAQFTSQVVTLWYRSPEILLQTSYGSAVDIWAFGCILSEMYNRSALIPGATEADQLRGIIAKFGKPHEFDWPPNAIVDHRCFPEAVRQPWNVLNPKITLFAANLVDKCLVWEQRLRITASEALSDYYFAGPYMAGSREFIEPHPSAIF